LLIILSLIIILIFHNKSGCLYVSSFIENDKITINTHDSDAVAVAILLFVSQNKAISHKISSECTSHRITFSQSIFLEISIFHSFNIYIAEASSSSLNNTSHADRCFS
jgi:hypothetical protein